MDIIEAYTAAVERHTALIADRGRVREVLKHKRLVAQFVMQKSQDEIHELQLELEALEARIETAAQQVDRLKMKLEENRG